MWSWGIGKSGSLGLGEVLTATHEPSKIHFRQPKVADQNKEKAKNNYGSSSDSEGDVRDLGKPVKIT